ncbi:tetratricopeptide repeat protein [Aestuariivivens sediminis]|uniref:tetratricopeptide repeat protein n=1 Tax=Aestuariivivens sediminis TaxID=2913557 RepID=UPI001F57D0CA|nr:tetratricopeptide repeat protein [Aestuariivivens sediminis]
MKQRGHLTYRNVLNVFPVIISVIALILYYPSLFGKFVIDDGSYFDDTVLTHLNLTDIKAVFRESTNRWGELLPLRDYLYVIEYNVFAEWTTGYHIISLMLFLASGFLVYYWTRVLFENHAFKDHTAANKNWLVKVSACILMSFFLLNPMYVESVAYISGQKDILSLFLIVASFFFLYKIGRKSTQNVVWLFLFGVLLHYLAVLSKLIALASIIFIPFLWLITSNKKSRDILKLVGFWLLANIPVFIWIQYVFAQPKLTDIMISTSVYERTLRAINILGHHLSRIAWPNELSFGYIFLWRKEYNFHWYTNFDLFTVIGLVFILVLMVLFFRYRNSLITLGMLLFIIYLLPVLSIFPDMPNEKIYDRYLAIPLLGIFLMVLSLMQLISRLWPKSKVALAGFVVFLWVSWSVMTVNYIPTFKSDLAVRENRYRLNPNNDFNIMNYVKLLISAKKFAQAEFIIENIDTNANLSECIVEYLLGLSYMDQNKVDQAEKLLYSSSIKASKTHDYPDANYLLAVIYLNKGKVALAEALLKEQLAHPYKPLYQTIRIEKLLKEIHDNKKKLEKSD